MSGRLGNYGNRDDLVAGMIVLALAIGGVVCFLGAAWIIWHGMW